MAAKRDVPRFFHEIRIPVVAAMIWAVLGMFLTPPINPIFDTVWEAVRVAFAATAGFLVTRQGKFGLWYATLAGALVMLADHIVVKGLYFIAIGELVAAGGVLLSYVMFGWVAAFVGLLGGLAGRVAARSNAAI
jgi:hypothetical protein